MELTAYEKNQRANPINAWLHSRRYRHIVREFEGIKLDRPIRVVDIGCAHAQLFAHIERFGIEYTGIELGSKLSNVARTRYGDRKNFRVITGSVFDHQDALAGADVVVALETLEHIPERLVVSLVDLISDKAPKRFYCSVPIEVGPVLWVKNVGSWLVRYPRYREYSWADTFWAGLYQLDRIAPHGTDHKGFDWRWLAQTLRQRFKVRTRTLPVAMLPAAFSTSAFFVCEPHAVTSQLQ